MISTHAFSNRSTGLTRRASVVFAAVAFAAVLPQVANAAPTPVPATIDVTGRADAKLPPDRAVVNAQIITSADDARAAASENDAIEARVAAAMTSLPLPPAALRVVNYQSEYVAPSKDPAAATQRHGYVVTRTIAVSATPAAVDAVTRALAAAGVDTIDAVVYDVADRRGGERRMLAMAMNDADLQARAIAAAAHVRVVRIVHLSVDQPVFAMHEMRAASFAAAAAPQAADLDLSATINATFEIAPL